MPTKDIFVSLSSSLDASLDAGFDFVVEKIRAEKMRVGVSN